MLGQWGHQVDIAHGRGRGGGGGLRRGLLLILMDVQMPIMDGIEATRRIRALPKPWSDVPILALTAHIFTEEIGALLRAGMDGHGASLSFRATCTTRSIGGVEDVPASHCRPARRTAIRGPNRRRRADDPGLFLNGEPVHDPAVLAELAS